MTCIPAHVSATKARLWAAEEVTFGVYESVLVNPVRIPLVSESLRETMSGGEAYHSIEEGYTPAGSNALGRSSTEGEIVTGFCVHGWGPLLLKHAVGAEYTTEFPEPIPLVLPKAIHQGLPGALPVGLSLVKALPYRGSAGGVYVQTFLGCRVDALTIRIAKGRAVEMRVQFIGRERVTDIPIVTDERYEPGDLEVPGDVFTVSMDRGSGLGLVGNVISAEFTIQNGLGDSVYGPEGGVLRDAVPQGRRTINGRIEALFSQADEGLIDQWLADADVPIVLTGVHAAAGPNKKVEFVFPAARIRGTPIPQISGRGLIRLDFTFQAMYDPGTGGEFRWLIWNDETGVSTGLVTRIP